MAPRHHVLLIGIDAYDGDGSLNGCVNDIDAVQRLLLGGVGIAAERITRLASPRTGTVHETTVPERLPTLDNLRAELTRLGTDEVAAGDHVLVYYSGHGTQCLVSDGQQRRFAREALLPKDKGNQFARRFLFDWELNRLLLGIAARTRRVTVVLDCCSSGGATRGDLADPEPGEPLDRFYPITELIPLEQREPPGGQPRGLTVAATGLEHCQVIAACREEERARENTGGDGRAHGELTRALVDALGALPAGDLATLRWGRVWRAVEAAVVGRSPRQHPWIAGSFGSEVFGFAAGDGDPGYAVVQVPAGYQLDVGRLHGVTRGAEVAVYGPDPAVFPPFGSAEEQAARAGVLRVERAGEATCTAVAIEPAGFQLPAAARGRLKAAGPDAALRVRLVPPDVAMAAVVAGSKLAEVKDEGADVELIRRAGGWELADEMRSLALIPEARVAAATVAVLDHCHAHLTPVRLARMCRDLPSALRLSLLDCGTVDLTPEQAQIADLPAVAPAAGGGPYGVHSGARLCFAVDNTAAEALSVTLIDCAASGRVLILGEARIPARSRHVFWEGAALGAPFVASLPDGVPGGVDRLVAIGASDPRTSLQHLARTRSFAELIDPQPLIAFRDFGAAKDAAGPPPDRWTATLTAVRIES